MHLTEVLAGRFQPIDHQVRQVPVQEGLQKGPKLGGFGPQKGLKWTHFGTLFW